MSSRLVLRRDLDTVTATLATAFADDPMVVWLTGTDDPVERRRRTIEGFFTPGVGAAFARGHCYATANCDAAAIWCPPDHELFDEQAGAALGSALVGACGPDVLDRLIALAELTGSRHPHDRPHFYLFLLGAATKGAGKGSQVVQPVLERCDADGLPAYLESSSARNVAFYERHGFTVQWEAAPDGGPVLRGMWREPGGGRG